MQNKYLIIIQARLGSTRFPNKVMQTVGGIPMVKKVWLEAKRATRCMENAEVVVAWPERYPDLDENNVLERFQRLSKEFKATRIIRLTADCPLIMNWDILRGYTNAFGTAYYSNHLDGRDVQVFDSWILFGDGYYINGDKGPNVVTHKEHVIADFSTERNKYGPRSVDTIEDLQYVRKLCATR